MKIILLGKIEFEHRYQKDTGMSFANSGLLAFEIPLDMDLRKKAKYTLKYSTLWKRNGIYAWGEQWNNLNPRDYIEVFTGEARWI